MIRSLILGLTASLLLALAACQTQPAKPDAQAPAEPVKPQLPFAEPETGPRELSSDIVFHYLVGEIGSHRSDLELAYNHYLHAALLAKDAYAAERATRIGLYLKDDAKALKAAARWVSLAPNDLGARQVAAVLYLRADNRPAALEQLEAMVQVADALEADGFLQMAAVLSKEKSVQEGVVALKELADAHPDDPRAHYALGVLQLSAKDYPAAEASARRALELRPGWTKPQLMLARLMVERGRPQEGRDLLLQLSKAEPEDTGVILALARMLMELDDHQGAYDQFRRVSKLDPQNLTVVYALGVLAMQLDNYADARRWWGVLVDKGNRSQRAEAEYHLGQVEELAERPRAAENHYRAVDEGVFQLEARLRLARLRAEAGALPEARDILRELRVLEPSRVVEFYLAEGEILKEYGTEAEVRDLYATALAARPDDPDLLYARGLNAAEQGQVEVMERDMRRILEQDPQHADALNALGYTLADLTTRYDEAYQLIQQALKIKPDNPAILDSMGWVLYRMGRYAESLEYLSKALEEFGDGEIAAHFGEVLWVTGDKAKARKVWHKALKESPDHPKLKEVMQRLDP